MRYNHFDMLPEKAFQPVGKRMTLEGGGGGGQTQTSQTTIDPTLKPFVEYGLGEAKNLYQQKGPGYFPGQTYVSPSTATQQALQAAQTRALQGSPLTTAAQQNVLNLQTAQNVANPMYQSLYGAAQTSPQAAQDVYSGLASGQITNAANPLNQFSASGGYLGSNPYFNAALSGAAQGATQNYYDAIKAAQGGAAQAGRYGSNVSADIQNRAAQTLGSTLANKYGELAYNQYGMERGLQEAAMGRLGSTSQSDIANRLAGAQNLTQAGQQEYANRLAAAGGLASTSDADLSRQLAAGQLAPTLAAQDYADIAQLANVGKTQESYQQQALQDAIDRYNYEANLPYQKLSQYAGLVAGTPQGSTTTSTSSGGGKIVCTMMNESYGTSPFRNRVWLAHSASMPNAKTYEKGYHTLFLPLVSFAKGKGIFNRIVKCTLEHIAKHRTADVYKEMRNGKRDTLGRIYRAILEPLCYVVGKLKGY